MRKGSPAVLICSNRSLYLGVAQLVERLLWEQEAVGSSPTTQTMRIHIPLATSLHHITDEIGKHKLNLFSGNVGFFGSGWGAGLVAVPKNYCREGGSYERRH